MATKPIIDEKLTAAVEELTELVITERMNDMYGEQQIARKILEIRALVGLPPVEAPVLKL